MQTALQRLRNSTENVIKYDNDPAIKEHVMAVNAVSTTKAGGDVSDDHGTGLQKMKLTENVQSVLR